MGCDVVLNLLDRVEKHGDDTDDRMERLLVMAQNTCYLHALLHNPRDPTLEIELNGATRAA